MAVFQDDNFITALRGVIPTNAPTEVDPSSPDSLGAPDAADYEVEEATSPAKGLWDLSTEIIRGNYGNGKERQQKLEAEGYNYHQVQDFVNKRIYGTLKDSDYDREYYTGATRNDPEAPDFDGPVPPDSVGAPDPGDATEVEWVDDNTFTADGKTFEWPQNAAEKDQYDWAMGVVTTYESPLYQQRIRLYGVNPREAADYVKAKAIIAQYPRTTQAPEAGDIDLETILSMGLDPNDYF